MVEAPIDGDQTLPWSIEPFSSAEVVPHAPSTSLQARLRAAVVAGVAKLAGWLDRRPALERAIMAGKPGVVVRQVVPRRRRAVPPTPIDMPVRFVDEDRSSTSHLARATRSTDVGETAARVVLARPGGHRLVATLDPTTIPNSGASVAIDDCIDTSRWRPLHMPNPTDRLLRLPDEMPPLDTRAFRRLCRAGRCATAVTIPPTIRLDEDGLVSLRSLAASGVPLVAEASWSELHRVGPTLGDALRPDPEDDGCEPSDLRSIRVRRAAFRDHGPTARCAELLDHLHLRAHQDPEVTVLLASRRPDFLLSAIDMVTAQRHCSVQLLVGLHGPGWDAITDDVICERHANSIVERFDASDDLGSVLAGLSARGDAPLVTKWDDDDWYGPNHIEDLVYAHHYSGAHIVGKAAEFVHLEELGITIRRFADGAETYSTTLAGGTLLMDADWLRTVGGWPAAPRHVDHLLLQASRAAGGVSYRTHGHQYLLRRDARPGHAHTWSADPRYFLADSVEQRLGLDLAFADIANSSPPA